MECFDESIRLALEVNHLGLLSPAYSWRGYTRLDMGELDQASRDFHSAATNRHGWNEVDLYLPMAGLGEVAWRRGHVETSAKLLGCAASKKEEICLVCG